MPTGTVKFKVGSSWELCRVRKNHIEIILNIWEKGIPFKVSFLFWRIWFRRIPIGEVLIRRGITDSMEFYCCNAHVQESFMHLFILCTDSYYVWKFFIEATGLHFSVIQLRQVLED